MTWQAASFVVLALAVGAGFLWYERSRPPARVLALVAALAALAVVGRVAFAAIPNVKPTTDIVLFAGYALGPIPGFVVGAVTALASNVFLGQGPWTVWQMAAWGGVGAGGALLAKLARGRDLPRVPLALACGVAGLAFGSFMDVYQWTLAARQDLDTYVAVSGSSLPYNLAHAIGNVVFCLLIGPVFLRALRRYRRRFEVRWERPAVARPAAVACALALAVGVGLTAVPPERAEGASASGKAARYLLRSQNRDGGFGGARGRASDQLFSGWAALGLTSVRKNPRDVHRRGGRSIATYLRRRAGAIRDIGEVERTILVLKGAGLSPRRFGGRNLVSQVLSRRRSNGSIAGFVSYTAFGMLALKAAGKPAGEASANWLARVQNDDGGFGVAPRVSSDTDMTGAVLQALRVAGRGGGPAARLAVRFLRASQKSDGGWGQTPARSSNAQSTAYAAQGLVAAGVDPRGVRRGGHSPIDYLKSLQRGNGSIRYSRSSTQTPVWVTAQALIALRRKPFPLKTAPRPRRRSGASAAASGAGGGGAGERSGGKGGGEAGGGSASTLDRFRSADGVPPLPDVAARETGKGSVAAADDGAGPPPWLVAGGAAAVLLAVGLVRWRLRRRHTGAA